MRSSIPREGDDSLYIRLNFITSLANLKGVTGPRTVRRTTKGKLSKLAKGLKALTPVLYRTPSTVQRLMLWQVPPWQFAAAARKNNVEVLQGSFTAKSGIHLTIPLPGTDFAYDDMGQAMERQLRLHGTDLLTLSVISSFLLIVDSNQANLLIDEIDAFSAKYPRQSFRFAVIQAHNSTVGTDAKTLASWQRICRCINIIPIHNERRNAQQSSRAGGHLEIFHTLEELCTYTIENRKYFLKA
ncbi:uncharacterized protein BO96DRAFT_439886 [Aspergillus niger CBS 101883]|uniref:Uncharacterized protein n=3 Tax=Aspergillus niger TaxID=5061 RepID=A2QSW1_ASPNC|nr:uncharacterized protein BO96DRAFT_439886 [Aspergillus niger CBS 101883]XP_059601273.1 hypothetical protein An08g12130 [Aspergillus niger]PYH50474.1 hypothetical protein BO96DRAFT_439886 [Aspergillus niger CBS 101883]RDH14176.1 hypothetical protein M747DRAFT_363684 [Aspergillus niger ATCC 13496]CAK40089.1 hypothetical protein An08g12130 [Aspergillus niger]